MYCQTIHNPAHDVKTGKTFKVEITLASGGVVSEWYWTAEEAYDARDRAYEFGFVSVRILGLPTIIGGC